MRRIILTDTSGETLPRCCRSAVRRVLKAPVNVTAEGEKCHAMVFCEYRGAWLQRDGRSSRRCVYGVYTLEGLVREFTGLEREEAIAEFFAVVFGKSVAATNAASSAPAGMLF